MTLLTKVCLVKAMDFLVVMYECESWTIKKTEHWRIDAFELWVWRRLLRVPWTARRSNQSILKEINLEYSLEGLMLKLKRQYFGYLMGRAVVVHSVVTNSLWPRGLQHARLPCTSPTFRAYSHLCPLSWSCNSTILSSVGPLSPQASIFPSIRVFSNESVLLIRWSKYWSFSFSISPSNEYSRLISFRMDWLDLLAVQRTLESSTAP